MVQVRVSETYDLSTQTGKMSLVAIHTPDLRLVRHLWGGLIQNYKYFRFVGCDVTMACASMLPADPLQIGTEAGSIAPQDMFNPILYKAVSNDSYNTLLNRIYQLVYGTEPPIRGASVDVDNDVQITTTDSKDITMDVYYALLADPDGWRKAMPQAGLDMRGLYPLVFQVLSTIGANQVATDVGQVDGGNLYNSIDFDGGLASMQVKPFMRGPSMAMPRLPTMMIANPVSGADILFASDRTAGTSQWLANLSPCYVAAMVLPPAVLNRLYYRMKVTWTIEFSELRPTTDIMNYQSLPNVANLCYGTDYATQSQAMSVTTSSVDALNADVDKIMEGV